MYQADNLTDLFLLVKVIDAGGFSAAARDMGTTRSLLSRRIIALERRLNAQLIHRNARQFEVTAVGEQVYRQAVAMCQAAAMAEKTARDSKGSPHGLVRVATHGLLSPLLAGLLPGFTEQQPQIRLTTHSEEDGIGALIRQRIDVHLSVGEALPDSHDVVARPLGGMRMALVVTPGLWRQLGQPSHPDEIPDDRRLSFAGSGFPGEWDLATVAPRRQKHLLTSADLSTLLSSARIGLGLAQVPVYACQEDLAAGRLRTVFEAFEAPPLPLHALTMPGRAVSDASLRLVHFAREQLTKGLQPGILPPA